MTARRIALGTAWLLMIAALLALGTWQVERRAWKLDLIARVDARIHAPPTPAPFHQPVGKPDEYRRVVVSGRYLAGKDALVQASTVRGPGWWVLTPLAAAQGTVMVNRGYVPTRRAPPAPTGPVQVVGLLRLSEPGGGFLRSNDPAADRWYSRDVAALARRDRVPTEPYFIDAEASSPTSGQPAPDQPAPDQPIGGLTVVTFTNNHLGYAITWYTLAMMTAAAFWVWVRAPRRAGPP